MAFLEPYDPKAHRWDIVESGDTCTIRHKFSRNLGLFLLGLFITLLLAIYLMGAYGRTPLLNVLAAAVSLSPLLFLGLARRIRISRSSRTVVVDRLLWGITLSSKSLPPDIKGFKVTVDVLHRNVMAKVPYDVEKGIVFYVAADGKEHLLLTTDSKGEATILSQLLGHRLGLPFR